MTVTESRSSRLLRGTRPRWLAAQLMGLRSETRTARTLTFDVPGWQGHLAGQHVDVRLTAEDGYAAQRAYSLAEPADGAHLSITVQEVLGGEVSPYLVEGMELGDMLEVRGPIGGWFVWSPSPDTPVEPPVLLVAGGSGIVPLMAMVRQRGQLGSTTPFRLVYSVREPDQVIYAHELEERAAEQGLLLDVIHTRTAPAGSRRPPGRITAADLAVPEHPGWRSGLAPRAYVCGPTAFVEHTIGLLVTAGYGNRSIRAERFGPSGG